MVAILTRTTCRKAPCYLNRIHSCSGGLRQPMERRESRTARKANGNTADATGSVERLGSG